MTWRIGTTAAFSVLLGAWSYLNAWSYEQSGSLPETLDNPFIVIAMVLIAVLVGFLVARPWVLLSLISPIVSLGYLQSTGKRGPDGVSPLTSPPGVFGLILFALFLGTGIFLASLWRQFRDRRSVRST